MYFIFNRCLTNGAMTRCPSIPRLSNSKQWGDGRNYLFEMYTTYSAVIQNDNPGVHEFITAYFRGTPAGILATLVPYYESLTDRKTLTPLHLVVPFGVTGAIPTDGYSLPQSTDLIDLKRAIYKNNMTAGVLMRADDDSTINTQLQRLFTMCDLLSSQVNNSRGNGLTRHALDVIKNHASDSLREVLLGYGEMLGRLNWTSAVDNIFEPRVNYCDKHISKIQPMAFLGVISAYTMINSTVLPVPPKPVFDHVRTTQLALFLFIVKRLKVEFDKDGMNAYSYMRRQYGVQPNKAGLIQVATMLTGL